MPDSSAPQDDAVLMSESIWRRGWKDAVRGWQDWRFILIDVIAIPSLALLVNPVIAVAAAAASLLLVGVGAIAIAPLRQRQEARDAWAIIRAAPETRVVQDLKAIRLRLCKKEVAGDEALLNYANTLRMGMTRAQLDDAIRQLYPGSNTNTLMQSDVMIQTWVEHRVVDVLERQTGRSTETYYKLNDLGAHASRSIRKERESLG